MPDVLPGLQVSLFGLGGESNVAGNAPDWEVLTGMLSYESKNLVLTGQYHDRTGNQKGSPLCGEGRALNQGGHSLLTEIRFPGHEGCSVIARSTPPGIASMGQLPWCVPDQGSRV
jgi:hypothetical protein